MDKNNFTTNLHKCCSTIKDEIRQWAIAVHFKNSFAYASEGHVLIRSSLEYHKILNPDFLEGKSIHRDNFKEILKFEIVECCEDGLSCRSADGQVAFYEYLKMEKDIPDFDKVFPSESKFKSLFQVGMNPKFVEMLASAMFTDDYAFRYRYTGPDSAILVDAIGFPGQLGILMPNALSDSIFEQEK